MSRIRLFIAAHLAAVLFLYALAAHIGDGWASPPVPALVAGPSAAAVRQPDSRTDSSPPSAPLVAPEPARPARAADHDLVRRSALQDLQSPWDRDQHTNTLIAGE